MRRALAYAATAVVIATAALAYARVGPAEWDPLANPVPGSTAGMQHARDLKLRGHVRGLFPGARRRMRIAIESRMARPIEVRMVRTFVHRRTPRACSGKNVRVKPFLGRLTIGPRRTRAVWVRVAMRRRAPNSCQKARFRLRFHVSARRT
jgi:hypothetical protein